MDFFYEGRFYRWGTPFALPAFPKLGRISKLRYALWMRAPLRGFSTVDTVCYYPEVRSISESVQVGRHRGQG